MRNLIFKVLLLFGTVGFIHCEGTFTVSGSKLIRLGEKYHASIYSQGYETPNILEVSLKDAKQKLAKNVTLVNGKYQNIEFDPLNEMSGDIYLKVESQTGQAFKKSMRLTTNAKKYATLIQTDKSIYKPADKVQFRVLVLDADMKPAKASQVQVFVTDGGQNRVKQFDNVTFTKGVFQSELKLSDLPVLGKWKINVEIKGEKVVTKEFEVAEYTLPKFEVTIDANPDANLKEGKIRATVRAKYTFGKIAKGNATVTAEVNNESRRGNKKVSKSVEVDGKKHVEFDIADELGITDKYIEKTVKLFATFKEELTEREQNATAQVTVHTTPYKIELKKSSEKFKPGLPFTVTALLRYHDKNAPVNDRHNPIIFTTTFYYFMKKTCYRQRAIGWSQPSDNEKYHYDCSSHHSYNVKKEIFVENGFAELQVEILPNSTKIDVEAKYFDTVVSSKNIQKEKSESNQFIQINVAGDKQKLSSNVKLNVKSTEPIKSLNYQVVGSGDILISEVVDVPNAKEAQIEFKPSLKMIPSSHVTVFYIRDDGEIVSDFVKLEFSNELKNFIDVDLSSEKMKPGEDIAISVSTRSNSFVGLLGVDQSVLVLKKGNDIEESTVFNEIEEFNKASTFYPSWQQSRDELKFESFAKSQSVIITNAKGSNNEQRYYDMPVPIYMQRRPQPAVMRFGGASSSYSYGSSHRADVAYPLPAHPGPSYDYEESEISDRVLMRGGSSYNSIEEPIAVPPKPIVVRTEFPETWLFESFDLDDISSNLTITKKVPDTITSWIITGFSVDPITGLGLTRKPSKFTVFQPFFVTTNLPYSIKRGEVVTIPVLVFNYMENDQNVEVTLFNAEKEFEFVDVGEDKPKAERDKREIATEKTKTIQVKSQSGVSVPFMVRPLKVGHITIKVVALSAVAGDGVEKQLIVEPEGVTQFMNEAVLVDLRENIRFSMNFEIIVPENAVPESTRIEALVVGDILGPSIDNLDKLIKLPYGCGEQNMLNFVPNIVVLDYLTSVGKLTPEIEKKAKQYMETGYQRELTYKHGDGSYSVFGKSDKSGSTWLTAYVAKSFHQASRFIQIDKKMIENAMDFLAENQARDGSFPEVGYVYDKTMQGVASKGQGLGLTAYTLVTFLENKDLAESYKSTIDKAMEYIVRNIDSLEDTYSLAIVAYAMQLAKHNSAKSLLAKLDEKAKIQDEFKHWARSESQPTGRPSSVNVEMTAYALQAFVEAGRETEAVPILKWLVTQRNENGGFQSTQDTVVGLQAMAKLAAKTYVRDSDIEVVIKSNVGHPAMIKVNEQNALILQKHELQSEARIFELSATGRGVSLVQVAYRYNLNMNGSARFILDPKVHENSNQEFLHLVVCAKFVPDESTKKSNMAVMEISLPSGFTHDTDSLPELKSTERVKKVELKDSETVVIIYFDDLTSKLICPEIKAYRTHSVAKQKPAPVKIYDYYDNSREASSFYNPPDISLCDICDGAEECTDQCEENEIIVD